MTTIHDDRYDDNEIVHMIYALGRTSDKLIVNEDGAKRYLINNDDKSLLSRHDKDLLDDLRDCTEFILDTDWNKTRFDYDYVKDINRHLIRTGSLKPGEERPKKVDLTISTDYGTWTPKPFERENVIKAIAYCNEKTNVSTVLRASKLFRTIVLEQPFGDGNQRTALLAANAFLVKMGDDCLFYPPIGGGYEREMAMLMSDLYIHNSNTIMWWIHDHAVNVRIRKNPARKKDYDTPLKIE